MDDGCITFATLINKSNQLKKSSNEKKISQKKDLVRKTVTEKSFRRNADLEQVRKPYNGHGLKFSEKW